MKKTNNNNYLFRFSLIFIICIVIFPLITKIPFVKEFLRYLLSFTGNSEYKTAYIELLGTIVGSFIAIFGALWTQRKIDEKKALNQKKMHARIIYYDFELAFKDLKRIFFETELELKRTQKTSVEDERKTFCQIACGRKLYLNQNWITDVAQLANTIPDHYIEKIYKTYGYLEDIDLAMQSEDWEKISDIYVSRICQFIDSKNELYGNHKIVLKVLDDFIKENNAK